MTYYFDTSALVKVYHPESGTPQVLTIYNSSDSLIISELARIEFASTFYRKHREGLLDLSLLQATLTLFENDCQLRYQIVSFSSAVIAEAKQLLAAHGQQFSIRTLDSLQLAFFKTYCKLPATFVCADAGLSKIVTKEGVTLLFIS